MFGISFFRVLKAASQNFWRNIWLSLATTIIMSLTLLMISFLYFANVLGVQVLTTIEQKVDLSASFKPEVKMEQIQIIAEEIKSREDVASVKVVSPEEALAQFRELRANDPLIEESLKELEDNPLPASIYITATEPRFYQNIDKQLESEKYAPYIDKVNYQGDSKNIIDRLIRFMSGVKNIGFIATTLFAVLVVLIMFNTIRLAIYSYREEIDIMRLVGASNWYIQGPFILEAITVALLGVVVCNIILFPFLNASSPQIRSFFFNGTSQFDLFHYALTHWLTIIGIQAGLAVFLAAISSMIAIRRYLRK